MFDDLIKKMKELESGLTVSVPVRTDDEGYLDRECPNEACLFQFKVFEQDWKDICRDEAIHCPLCGHQAPSKSWWTKEQIESAKEQAIGVMTATINKSLADSARAFNRKQKPGFITMSMTVTGGRDNHTVVPIAALEAMKLKIQCESCATRFAVVGSAFFCPSCGHNSVERIFEDALRKVEAKIDNLETVRTAIESSVDKDTAEVTCRSLLETGLNDCVVAFQKLMDSLYATIPNAKKPPFSVFQKLDAGSTLWKEACGSGYEDLIHQQELDELNVYFQRRHLLSHTEGFVDERYIRNSGDSQYKVGQRIVVRERDVRRLVELVRNLSSKIAEVQTAAIVSSKAKFDKGPNEA